MTYRHVVASLILWFAFVQAGSEGCSAHAATESVLVAQGVSHDEAPYPFVPALDLKRIVAVEPALENDRRRLHTDSGRLRGGSGIRSSSAARLASFRQPETWSSSVPLFRMKEALLL